MRQDFFCPVYRMSCSCLPLLTPRCDQREQPYPAFSNNKKAGKGLNQFGEGPDEGVHSVGGFEGNKR